MPARPSRLSVFSGSEHSASRASKGRAAACELRPEAAPLTFPLSRSPGPGDCHVVRGVCPIGSLAAGRPPCSAEFACGPQRFALRLWTGAQGFSFQLQCIEPPADGVYVQCLFRVRGRRGAEQPEKLVHELFRRGPPWGRAERGVLPDGALQDRSRGLSRRRTVPGCGLCLCAEVELLLRAVSCRGGGYLIQPLPRHFDPAAAATAGASPERGGDRGGSWGNIPISMQAVPGSEGRLLRVRDLDEGLGALPGRPGASLHAAAWRIALPRSPAGPGWEFAVRLLRAAAGVGEFGGPWVGLATPSAFRTDPSSLPDGMAVAFAAGHASAIGSGRTPVEAFHGGADSVAVRVAGDAVQWRIGGGRWSAPLRLPSEMRGGLPLLPFAALCAPGDECEMLYLRPATDADDEAEQREEEQLHHIFTAADRDGDEIVSAEELRLLALRTGRLSDGFDPEAVIAAVRQAGGCGADTPGLDFAGLRVWYERGPWDLEQDAAAIAERRDMAAAELAAEGAAAAAGAPPPHWGPLPASAQPAPEEEAAAAGEARWGSRGDFSARGLTAADWEGAPVMPEEELPPAGESGAAAPAPEAEFDVRKDPRDGQWKRRGDFEGAEAREDEWEQAEKPDPRFNALVAVTAAIASGEWAAVPSQDEGPPTYTRAADGSSHSAAAFLSLLEDAYLAGLNGAAAAAEAAAAVADAAVASP